MLIPSKALVVGHSDITQPLQKWFQDHGFTKRFIVPRQVTPMLCARNFGIKQALVTAATSQGECEWVVFCDSDVFPCESATDEFLQLEADLISCRCETDNPGAFGGVEAFHWALSAIKIDVLKKLSAPWVTSEYNEDGTRLLRCDCATFAAKCKAVGAVIRHGGLCIHQHRGSWHTKTY